MEWSTAIVGVPGCRNKPTVLEGGYGRWRMTQYYICQNWRLDVFDFRASNHKSTRATPGSFASIIYCCDENCGDSRFS